MCLSDTQGKLFCLRRGIFQGNFRSDHQDKIILKGLSDAKYLTMGGANPVDWRLLYCNSFLSANTLFFCIEN